MGTLLKERGQDIYRSKGILSVEGLDRRFVFQGVHMMFDGSPQDPWKPEDKRTSRLIFIGKGLDRAELTAGFDACLRQQ